MPTDRSGKTRQSIGFDSAVPRRTLFVPRNGNGSGLAAVLHDVGGGRLVHGPGRREAGMAGL